MRLKQLQKEYNTVSAEIRRSKTVEARAAVARRFDTFAARFLEIADKNPRDVVALKAIRAAIQAIVSTDSRAYNLADFHPGHAVPGSSDGSTQRIVEVLRRDHIKSDKLGPICDRIRYSYRPQFEVFLRAVLKENSHRPVKGLAQLALAQLQHNQLRLLDLAKGRPDLTKRYETIYGKGYIARLRAIGRATLLKRIERDYQLASRYDDVINAPFQISVAKKAQAELFELRHLVPGKEAPEIQGRDQDGKRFKLSDYRGKVVLLYFWQEY